MYLCIDDFEKSALEILPKVAGDFFSGAAGNYAGLHRNKSAFAKLLIRPRVLRDISIIDLSVSILGGKRILPSPIGACPTAFHGFAHSDGEIATAKGCAAAGVLSCYSQASTKSMERIAAAAQSPKWQNVYLYKSKPLLEQMVNRAEAAGFEAIVASLDIPCLGKRSYNLLSGYQPLTINAMKLDWAGNFPAGDTEHICGDPASTWQDFAALIKLSRLPVIAKGVVTGEDAKRAVDVGAAAVWVSTHGGRQHDSFSASIEALSEVVKAVGHRCDVYLDGGVRCGSDVFKALALGAKMVFVGRPVIFGLAVQGPEGVKTIFDILNEELKNTMALTGCSTVADISQQYIVHEQHYKANL